MMRKLAVFLFLPLIFSCGQKPPEQIEDVVEVVDSLPKKEIVPQPIEEEIAETKQENLFENLSFAVDTILINSGNSLVNLQYGLSRSALSPDKSDLFVFNPNPAILYQFDLADKKLVRQIQFDKDGPNSVGNRVSYFQYLDQNSVFMAGYNNPGLYNLAAEKQSSIQVPEGTFGILNQEQIESLFSPVKINFSQTKLFSIPTSAEEEKVSLAIFDLKTEKGKLIKLPQFEFLTKLNLLFKQGISSAVSNTGTLSLAMERNRLIIYSEGTSGIYVYDLSSGTLSYRSPGHKLVPNQQIPPATRKFSTIEQFEEAHQKTLSQISYKDVVYDEGRKMYFRFGSILEKSEVLEPWPDSEVFLFAYDQDFNLVGETEVEGLTKVPKWPFFKDGKLWSYVNVEDELGFAVIDFKF